MTRRATADARGAATGAAFGGVEPSRGLAWLLAVLARRDGAPLTASGLLWLFVYAGWRAGFLDADAVLWLSAGVVLAAHALAIGDRRGDGPDRRDRLRSRADRYPDASR